MVDGSFWRKGYEVRCFYSPGDDDKYTLRIPDSDYFPEYAGRSLLLKTPRCAFWQALTDLQANDSCPNTNACIQASALAFEDDDTLHDEYILIVLPEGKVLNNDIMSNHSRDVMLVDKPLFLEGSDAQNPIAEDLFQGMLRWRIAERGTGQRIARAVRTKDMKTKWSKTTTEEQKNANGEDAS
mmetsp:Transcript_16716/g.46803  ORF Transcript_16716/g.46803 Transcript_16716/m.46803 type:complete len:183 (+) Transcript_16716:253-801(+)